MTVLLVGRCPRCARTVKYQATAAPPRCQNRPCNVQVVPAGAAPAPQRTLDSFGARRGACCFSLKS